MREQVWLASASFAALGILLSGKWSVLCLYVVFFFCLLCLRRLWKPFPKKTLRSVGILLSLILASYAWSDNLRGGIIAGLKVVGLFLLSLSVMRGIGTTGIHRAVRATGKRLPGPWAQTSALVLMPYLMSRLHREWRKLDPALKQKGFGLGRLWAPLYKLRTLFWKSQAWPSRIFLAYSLRAGSVEIELKLPETAFVRFVDLVVLMVSIGAFVASIVIGRQ